MPLSSSGLPPRRWASRSKSSSTIPPPASSSTRARSGCRSAPPVPSASDCTGSLVRRGQWSARDPACAAAQARGGGRKAALCRVRDTGAHVLAARGGSEHRRLGSASPLSARRQMLMHPLHTGLRYYYSPAALRAQPRRTMLILARAVLVAAMVVVALPLAKRGCGACRSHAARRAHEPPAVSLCLGMRLTGHAGAPSSLRGALATHPSGVAVTRAVRAAPHRGWRRAALLRAPPGGRSLRRRWGHASPVGSHSALAAPSPLPPDAKARPVGSAVRVELGWASHSDRLLRCPLRANSADQGLLYVELDKVSHDDVHSYVHHKHHAHSSALASTTGSAAQAHGHSHGHSHGQSHGESSPHSGADLHSVGSDAPKL